MTWISKEYIPELVSIIIPIYNREKLIIETLNSITKQTYRPIECLLVDDGSKDNSAFVIQQFIDQFNGNIEFKYIHQDNRGAQVARNKGTIHSKGEYIQYLDSDDVLFENKISEQVNFLRNNPNLQGVYGDWVVGKPDDFTEKYSPFSLTGGHVIDYIKNGSLVNFCVLMTRRSIINTGTWDEKLTINEEIDYHIRFLLNGNRMGYNKLICGLWRTHEGYRLSKNNNFSNLLYYYTKTINALKETNNWSNEIGLNIANKMLWDSLSRNFNDQPLKIEIILLAHSLDNNLLPFQSKKIKLLSNFIGNRLSVIVWLKSINKYKKIL